MIPIRIAAELVGPIAYHADEGISLDGPLLYAAVVEQLGHGAFGDVPDNRTLADASARPHPGVPLGVHGTGDHWAYCCSLAEPGGGHGSERLHWHKRFDDALAMRALERGGMAIDRKAVVNIASGEFRAQRVPLYVEHVETLHWYAIGDPDRIAQLLHSHVQHVGKKRNTGYGVVARWVVEPWDGPVDRWLWQDERHTHPARAIPLAWCPSWEGERGYAAIRPPYWLASNQQWCAVPTSQLGT